jgi:hypothetical protein
MIRHAPSIGIGIGLSLRSQGFGVSYVKAGRVLDYSTQVGPFTIIDQSGEGNTATLYSGRGLTMDAVNDRVTYPTGYGGESRTATVWMRVTSLGARTLNSPGGVFIFTPTATNVWEQLSSTAGPLASLSWTAGSDCDIGDLVIGTEHWTHNDWSDPTGDTSNGKAIVDSGPNQLHGTCTGCSGFTGEATIPQTADKNWNKRVGVGNPENITAGTDGYNTFTVNDPLSFTASETSGVGMGGWELPVNAVLGDVLRVSFTCASDQSPSCQVRFSAANSLTRSNSVLVPNPNGTNVIDFTMTGNGKMVTFTEADVPTTITISNFLVEVISGTDQTMQLVSASDANDQIDAYGTAISQPRTNTQVINLFDEGELVTTPAAASLDTIKTVSGWIWHDATARTVFDLGTPTVGTTTTALTSSGFTGVTYFVNGASGTTLSAGWNHCVVASTAALATDNIDILAKSGSQIDYDVTLTVAEALVNYDAQKSLYGL